MFLYCWNTMEGRSPCDHWSCILISKSVSVGQYPYLYLVSLYSWSLVLTYYIYLPPVLTSITIKPRRSYPYTSVIYTFAMPTEVCIPYSASLVFIPFLDTYSYLLSLLSYFIHGQGRVTVSGKRFGVERRWISLVSRYSWSGSGSALRFLRFGQGPYFDDNQAQSTILHLAPGVQYLLGLRRPSYDLGAQI